MPVKGLSTEQALDYTLEKYRAREALALEIGTANEGVRARLERYVTLLKDVFAKAKPV